MVIIILGVSVSIVLFSYVSSNEQNKIDYARRLAADERLHAIHAEGDVLGKLIQGFQGLYAALDNVGAEGFSIFSRNVVLPHDYLNAVFWLPHQPDETPAYPVTYAEPEGYLRIARSIDTANNRQLARQLQQARRENRMLVMPHQTNPNGKLHESLKLLVPITGNGAQQTGGFLMLWLDFPQFIETALQHRVTGNYKLDLFIVAATGDNQLLLYHPANPPGQTVPVNLGDELQATYQQPLHLLGQDWQLYIKPLDGEFPSDMPLIPWFALLAALSITFLVAGFVNASMNRRQYAEALVTERTRALSKSEERLAELYSIISSDKNFADKARAMLAYGCKQLGLEYGILSQIEQDRYTIKYAWSHDNSLEEASQFALGDTYCRQTLTNNGVTSVTHAGNSDWNRHPCYDLFKLEAYIGTPLHVNGQVYGTLNFSSVSAHATAFTQAEHELVQLMAQWLGMELAHIQFENQALEQKNTISHILESTSEAFIAVDHQQCILYANSLTTTLLDLDDEPLAGKTLQQVAPELLPVFGSALSNALKNNLSTQLERYYPTNKKWLEAAIHPSMQGATISLRDISARKRNAEILSQTLAIKKSILDSANFTIIATDVDGTIMSFNKAAERLLGYRAEEMIGRHTPAILHDPHEVASRAQALSEEMGTAIEPGFEVFIARARRGIPDENEWTLIRKDGSRFPVLLSITEMTDEQGACIGFLGIGVDITERKRIERVRDDFISTVSHELRTPLTSIRGSLGLLTGNFPGELPAQAVSLLDIAGRNADRLLHLINDILDINKIESGKMSFRYAPLALAGFLQQAVEQNRSYADQFRVVLRLDATLPDVTLYADEHRLMQVMSNLLSNAVKFSPDGGDVEIHANTYQDFVRISVSDHGIGIPEEFQQKVFDKFTQADSSDSRHTGGTGLGMNIANAIVEQHGGKLGFVSQEGVGTTFYFDLPIYDSQAITRIKDQIFSQSPPRSPRLLICADDHDIANLLQLILARHGCQSEIAHTAGRARELLGQHHYHGLLLDILLPDLHGLKLIKQLRESADTAQLPIIVISAIPDTARQQLEGGAANIIDWLDKPLDQERLLQAVNRALRQASNRPRILHVEDDAELQNVVQRMLEDQAQLIAANNLQQARLLLEHNQYDLVLLDVSLPDGSGLELLERFKTLDQPPAVVIFSNRELDNEYSEQVSAALLKSATSRQTLMDTISACLQQLC